MKLDVYCLLDPTLPGNYEYNGFKFKHMPRYVGISKNTKVRISQHLTEAKEHNHNWKKEKAIVLVQNAM